MVTITVTRQQLVVLDHDIHIGNHTLRALREVGVPVIGVLWPMGVESGVLSMRVDSLTEDMVWTWEN